MARFGSSLLCREMVRYPLVICVALEQFAES